MMTFPRKAALSTAMILATACSGPASTETSSPDSTIFTTSTVPAVEESTTTTAQPTTSVSEVSGWEAIRVWRGGQGEFRTGVFEPSFSFSVEAAGWTQAGGDTDRMIDMLKGDMSLAVILLEKGDVDETIEFLTDLEGVDPTGAPQEVSVDDAQGLQIELSANANTKVVTFADEGGYQMILGYDYRVSVVEVEETVVSIFVEIPPGTPQRRVDEATAIVESIRWRSTS